MCIIMYVFICVMFICSIFICVMFICEYVYISGNMFALDYVYVWIRLRVYSCSHACVFLCVCVCVCVCRLHISPANYFNGSPFCKYFWKNINCPFCRYCNSFWVYIWIWLYVYSYKYACVCVSVCVRVKTAHLSSQLFQLLSANMWWLIYFKYKYDYPYI